MPKHKDHAKNVPEVELRRRALFVKVTSPGCSVDKQNVKFLITIFSYTFIRWQTCHLFDITVLHMRGSNDTTTEWGLTGQRD